VVADNTINTNKTSLLHLKTKNIKRKTKRWTISGLTEYIHLITIKIIQKNNLFIAKCYMQKPAIRSNKKALITALSSSYFFNSNLSSIFVVGNFVYFIDFISFFVFLLCVKFACSRHQNSFFVFCSTLNWSQNGC